MLVLCVSLNMSATCCGRLNRTAQRAARHGRAGCEVTHCASSSRPAPALVALDDISLSIAPGEILGVVGESGAGKSLTGAALIGLLDPPGRISGGEIRFDGRRIDDLPYEQMRRVRGRSIGAIFQDPLTSLDPLYTVGQQLVETIQTHLSLNGADARRRAIRLLQETGIPAAEERLDQYPHQFSGGMRQRS